jgi:hypothetical protein
VSDHRYEFHVHNAASVASTILGEAPPQPLSWLLPATASIDLDDDWHSDDGSEVDITGDLIAEALDDNDNHAIEMSWKVPVRCHVIDYSPQLISLLGWNPE